MRSNLIFIFFLFIYQLHSQQRDLSPSIIEKGSLYGYKNKQGEISVPISYKFLSYSFETKKLIALKNYKYGIITELNEIVLPFEYDGIKILYNNYYIIKKGMKFGLFRSNGNWVTNQFHEDIYLARSSSHFLIKDSGLIGLIDTLGNTLVTPEYKSITLISEGYETHKERFVVTNQNGKKGLIDFQGKILLPTIYDDIVRKHTDFIIVKANNKLGAFNSKQELLLPLEYDNVNNLGVRLGFNSIVLRNEKYSMVSLTGKTLTKQEYSNLECLGDFILTKVQDRIGLLDKNGKVLLANTYIEINPHTITNDLSRVFAKKDSLYALFDGRGTQLTNYEFDKIEYVRSLEFFAVEKNKKWGIVSIDGKILKKYIYDKIIPNSGVIYGEVNGKKDILGYFKFN